MATGLVGIAAVEQDYVVVDWRGTLPSDLTVTVATGGGCGPDPSGFAAAGGTAASSRNASVMSAHTWEKIISIVTVQAPDRSSAVAVARAVVSEALRPPAATSSR